MVIDLRIGDCLTDMANLPAGSVDVSMSDPPYDEHTHRSGRRGEIGKRDAAHGSRASFNRNRDLGFEPITPEQMAVAASEFARVTKRWVLVFCTLEMVGDPGGKGWRGHLERAGLDYVRTCIWHKVGATPQFTGDRPAQAAEAIAWATQPNEWPDALVLAHRKGRKRWNGGGKHGHYSHPIVLNRGGTNERLHTTQKPLALMRELVEDFTDPGETVLDAFMGSGTTGLACQQLGRGFIGFERDPNYFDIACRRLRGEEAKPRAEQPSLLDWRSV